MSATISLWQAMKELPYKYEYRYEYRYDGGDAPDSADEDEAEGMGRGGDTI